MEDMSSLQYEILAKYSRLLKILQSIDKSLEEITSENTQSNKDIIVDAGEQPTNTNLYKNNDIANLNLQMRQIEMKLNLVGTLLKSSVYSVLQTYENNYLNKTSEDSSDKRD
ncbi:hypothetical protein TBLA_0A01490 [Henningerozyma blattae CBS 6284]|uniref:Uncharacterized protein n=1 Tax=Henningerozyma blattae (strain ATCC 34711 / CBS 6284 / DSM 70876 / NBRC 10599 / NRRL Y-10934 / UCD 77-7) TaxID=1071380 RepID=I2GUZ6_HENB6|nr:hypothetical protein TBLA_0A01490 [Tetrapisispora blattae CBS 6284]CCH57948.1 hypothetical protein TBLA_0A01490 [Tetrapisispora blattae CBS 6284]